eukprot:gene25132-10773_t
METSTVGVFKPSFSCTPVNSPDERRAIHRYLFSRYNLKMMEGPPKFGNSMYFNRTLPPHGSKNNPATASTHNMMFRAKYNAIGRHHQPHMFDDDTLIEGEMEDHLLDEVYPTNITKEQTHRVFCATDVLVWHGRPVGVGHHGPSGQQQCMMNATQRTELLHTWYAEFERCNNNLPEETEYASARLEPEAVRHLFYVRATHMPDVYELYREEVSASLSRSPDAFAGVRSMRDSLIMRSLFSASSSGGATLSQCMFVFDTVIGKWTPE